MSNKSWRGVSGVTVSSDGNWLGIDGLAGRAHINVVDNTLYTMCSDDKSADFADNDQLYNQWCADHPDIVLDCIERMMERDAGAEPNMPESVCNTYVTDVRVHADIVIYGDSLAYFDMRIPGTGRDAVATITIPIATLNALMQTRPSLDIIEKIDSSAIEALRHFKYADGYDFTFISSGITAEHLRLNYAAEPKQ